MSDQELEDLVQLAAYGGLRAEYLAMEARKEIKERRATDLSAEEVVALRYLREHVQFVAPVSHQTPGMEMNRAVFALDKLIAAAEARRG